MFPFFLFIKQKRAASTTELGLLAGLIAITVILSMSMVGSQIKNLFAASGNELIQINETLETGIRWQNGSLPSELFISYEIPTSVTLPSATDASGLPITYSLTGDLHGSSYDPQNNLLSGTPSQTGVINLILTADNGYSQSTRSIQIKVVEVPKSCQEISNTPYDQGNGAYLISISGISQQAICNMDDANGGWTMIADITNASSSNSWVSTFDDQGLIYTEMLFTFEENHISWYAYPTNFRKATASILPFQLNFRQGSTPWQEPSTSVLEYAPASNCIFSQDTPTANKCISKLIASVSNTDNFNQVADYESSRNTSTSDNYHKLDFKIFVR